MEDSLVKTMLPFKIQQLLETIIEDNALTIKEAIVYLYSSDLYKQMSADDSYLWQLSTANLYDMLQTEKNREREEEDHSAPLLLFISFCLENYKEAKQLSAEETLFLFNRYGVIDYLKEVFCALHTQGKEYIISDIDEYINNRRKP